jgi:nicotinamide riboside kinase
LRRLEVEPTHAGKRRTLRIAVLGAESTGKTVLCAKLRARLADQGIGAALVTEVLREWCMRHGRTPQSHEQEAIAREQAARTGAAAATHAVVLADTTPLMTAIYSDLLFGDTTLYPFALAEQRRFDATLVTGLDLPWVPDGIQRDGPHVRAPVDRAIRAALAEAAIPFHTVYGQGTARTDNALRALFATLSIAIDRDWMRANASFLDEKPQPRWTCESCSDPACEHALFRRLL